MSVHWDGLRDVLVVSLVAGVGLVALFASGVRLLVQATDVPGGGRTAARRALRIGAGACFALCAAIAVYGTILLLRK
jgi:hypothetical protein